MGWIRHGCRNHQQVGPIIKSVQKSSADGIQLSLRNNKDVNDVHQNKHEVVENYKEKCRASTPRQKEEEDGNMRKSINDRGEKKKIKPRR